MPVQYIIKYINTEIEIWTIFNTNQYNNQANKKDDHADEDHLYYTAGQISTME